MKRIAFIMVFLMAVTLFAKKPMLRAELLHAKFVVVTAYPDGGSFGGGARTADDAKAVANVERAVRDWGRWTVISSKNQADLIIAVRRGKIATAGARIPIGSGDSQTEATHPAVIAEAGPNEDMIAIYSAKNFSNDNYPQGDPNIDTAPLWRLIQADALEAPGLRGIQQLRTEIEKAEAEQKNAKK